MDELFENQRPVDMSPEAIAQRLRDLQQLYLFSISLTRARLVDAARHELDEAANSTGRKASLSE